VATSTLAVTLGVALFWYWKEPLWFPWNVIWTPIYHPFTSYYACCEETVFFFVVWHWFSFYFLSAKNFIKCLLQIDPKRRYTCKQALAHPWYVHLIIPVCPLHVFVFLYVLYNLAFVCHTTPPRCRRHPCGPREGDVVSSAAVIRVVTQGLQGARKAQKK